MTFHYQTKGVCSRTMELDIGDDGMIRRLSVIGGCHGNSQGLERLVEGRGAVEIRDLLRGVCCKEKATSCPDQLSYAIDEALEEMQKSQEEGERSG